jgi:hypothetical protein
LVPGNSTRPFEFDLPDLNASFSKCFSTGAPWIIFIVATYIKIPLKIYKTAILLIILILNFSLHFYNKLKNSKAKKVENLWLTISDYFSEIIKGNVEENIF